MLALTVSVRLLTPSATAPLPRFRPLLPRKTKSPFQFWALLVEIEAGEAAVQRAAADRKQAAAQGR